MAAWGGVRARGGGAGRRVRAGGVGGGSGGRGGRRRLQGTPGPCADRTGSSASPRYGAGVRSVVRGGRAGDKEKRGVKKSGPGCLAKRPSLARIFLLVGRACRQGEQE